MNAANLHSNPDTLKIVIFCTPRVGNTWLRHILVDLYDLEQTVTNDVYAMDFESLPKRFIFTTHANYDPVLAKRIQKAGFRILTISRHPLDMMVSLLHHTYFQHAGEGQELRGLIPRCRAHMNFIQSNQAVQLFDMSYQWWAIPNVITIRYEDLVSDTNKEVQRIVDVLAPTQKSIPDAIAKNSMQDLRKRFPYQQTHFWQGKPGLWKEFFTKEDVEELKPTLNQYVERFGYSLEANPNLNALIAEQNWMRSAGSELLCAARMESIHRERIDRELLPQIKHLENCLEDMTKQRDAISNELVRMGDTAERLFDEVHGYRLQQIKEQKETVAEEFIVTRRLEQLNHRLNLIQQHMKAYEGLGRFSTRIARSIQRVMNVVRILGLKR